SAFVSFTISRIDFSLSTVAPPNAQCCADNDTRCGSGSKNRKWTLFLDPVERNASILRTSVRTAPQLCGLLSEQALCFFSLACGDCFPLLGRGSRSFCQIGHSRIACLDRRCIGTKFVVIVYHQTLSQC